MGYFLIHGGSGDHTSEDRVRGICSVLPEQPEIFSASPEEDWQYGLAELGALSRIRPGSVTRRIKRGDWCVTANPTAARGTGRGVRRMLWGWEPAGEISRKQAKELARFHRIVVTDLRSRTLLIKAGLGRSVRLGPDPSFLVRRCLRPAESLLHGETVGLCVSASVAGFEVHPGLLFQSYCHLIRWILRNTPWQIALIPYCAQKGNDDQQLDLALLRQFAGEDRLLIRPDGSSRELRGDLSLCRYCVGTAGVPAAWSCGVPGLCIGDSRRARSLSATLMGASCGAVIRADGLKEKDDLCRHFQRFLEKEDAMRQWLAVSVPRYRQWARDWRWQE